MASQAPGSQHNTTSARIYTELKKNWWMWGSVAFTVLLISSLFIFRNSLYDTAAHGLPFLAVKENAAEACATTCKAEQDTPGVAIAGSAGDQGTPIKEAYDTCYTKCVAQETKEVAEEREKFKKSEESFEKEVEEKELQKGADPVAQGLKP